MKKVILILVAIALQVLYYLSEAKVVEINIISNCWLRFSVMMPSLFVGSIVADSCNKHIRKWLFNISYLLSLACGIAVYLNISGVNLGVYTYAMIFTTVFPLSYGAYLCCSSKIRKDNEECEEASPCPPNLFEPAEPEDVYTLAPAECTREDMLDQLPQSAQVSNETLFKIKEQLVGGLQRLNIKIKCVKLNVGEESLTYHLYYDTISTEIRASGFPCNLNAFYRLESVDREEKIITIDIPYKE